MNKLSVIKIGDHKWVITDGENTSKPYRTKTEAEAMRLIAEYDMQVAEKKVEKTSSNVLHSEEKCGILSIDKTNKEKSMNNKTVKVVNTRNNGNRNIVRNLLIDAVNERKVDMVALTKKLGYDNKSRTVTMVKRRAAEYCMDVTFKGRYATITQDMVC